MTKGANELRRFGIVLEALGPGKCQSVRCLGERPVKPAGSDLGRLAR